MTGRRVVPLTRMVNSTRPVASTATKRCTSCGSAGFSVTASASTSVSAPRSPPQAMASLNEVLIGWVSLARLNNGKSRKSSRRRAAKAEAMSAATRTRSRNSMSTRSLGTSMDASTKTSECAQKAICAQRSVRNDQLYGVMRERPNALTIKPRRKHRHHARHVKEALGRDEGEIGERDRERRFREAIVARNRGELEQDAAGERPENGPADKGDDEFDGAAEDIGLAPLDDHSEEDHEEHDRRRVVEQRFTLDEPGEARRRSDIPENRDHGGRVRGRGHRAEEEADDERHARERPKRDADDRGRDERRDDREHQDRRRILEHAPHVAGERRLEDERRQEDVDQGLRPDRQIGEQLRRSSRNAAKAACAGGRSRRRRSRRRSRREARPGKA